jgi:hypothetical protein
MVLESITVAREVGVNMMETFCGVAGNGAARASAFHGTIIS